METDALCLLFYFSFLLHPSPHPTLVVLRIEPWVLCILGKHSTPKVQIWAQTGLGIWPGWSQTLDPPPLLHEHWLNEHGSLHSTVQFSVTSFFLWDLAPLVSWTSVFLTCCSLTHHHKGCSLNNTHIYESGIGAQFSWVFCSGPFPRLPESGSQQRLNSGKVYLQVPCKLARTEALSFSVSHRLSWALCFVHLEAYFIKDIKGEFAVKMEVSLITLAVVTPTTHAQVTSLPTFKGIWTWKVGIS